MRNLKLFQFQTEYDSYMDNIEYLPNVSYVKENGIVYFNSLKSNDLDPELLDIAGTAIVYDTKLSKLITVGGEEYNTTDYPQDTFIPVGIVIMPASHTEDGVARMMSLKLMGTKTTDDGTVTYGSWDASNMSEFDKDGTIAWASPSSSTARAATSALIAYYENQSEQFPQTGIQPAIAYDETNGANVYDIHSTNTFGMFYYTNINLTESGMGSMIGTNWIADGETGYGWNCDASLSTIAEAHDKLMPSPYNADGTANLNMRASGSSMGFVHGKKATDMVNAYVADSVENNRFDIFEATKIYKTEGTKQGDWYVPSSLELAYFSARMKEIYSTMNKMNPNFDETFDSMLGADSSVDYNYLTSWTSTLFSSSYAWSGGLPVNSNYGIVSNDGYVFVVAPVRNL